MNMIDDFEERFSNRLSGLCSLGSCGYGGSGGSVGECVGESGCPTDGGYDGPWGGHPCAMPNAHSWEGYCASKGVKDYSVYIAAGVGNEAGGKMASKAKFGKYLSVATRLNAGAFAGYGVYNIIDYICRGYINPYDTQYQPGGGNR